MNMMTTPQVRDLKDVEMLLPALYSESSQKVYRATLRKVEKLTGRPLSSFVAEERAWYEAASKITWAGAFPAATPEAEERAFKAFVNRVGASIRLARKHLAAPYIRGATDTAWERLETYVRDTENTFGPDGNRILPNMLSLSIANLRARCNDTHPAALNTAIVSAALFVAPPDKAEILRNSTNAHTRLWAARAAHPAIADLLPQQPIGKLPGLRDPALDWSRFSPAFLKSRDRAIRRAIKGDQVPPDKFGGKLGHDPIGQRRAARKGQRRRVRNVDAAEKRHLNALSWLIRHAFPDRSLAYALCDIAEVFTVDTIERGVTAYVARASASPALLDPKMTSSGTTILSSLETLARRNGYDEEVLWAIDDARYEKVDSFQAREMSAEREKFVKLVERNPAIARAIISGPRRLKEETETAFKNWDNLGPRARTEMLHLSMGAGLIALQLARSLRSKNLNLLLIEGPDAELLRPLRESRPWLDIAKGRVKNRRPIEGEIPERQWKVIVHWLDEGLPRWCEMHDIDAKTNLHLVPGPKGILSRQSFNRIWNRCVARLGVPDLKPHLMRHVAATLWLAAHPGDYATVAAFLCDSVKTVEKFYARGEGAAAARLFAEVLEALDPTLKSYLERR